LFNHDNLRFGPALRFLEPYAAVLAKKTINKSNSLPGADPFQKLPYRHGGQPADNPTEIAWKPSVESDDQISPKITLTTKIAPNVATIRGQNAIRRFLLFETIFDPELNL